MIRGSDKLPICTNMQILKQSTTNEKSVDWVSMHTAVFIAEARVSLLKRTDLHHDGGDKRTENNTHLDTMTMLV